MTDPDQYSEAETKRRADAAIKKMLATPPKPHADQKPIGKKRKSPKRKAKKA